MGVHFNNNLMTGSCTVSYLWNSECKQMCDLCAIIRFTTFFLWHLEARSTQLTIVCKHGLKFGVRFIYDKFKKLVA